MAKKFKPSAISAKTAAVFFFLLWILTLIGFAYVNVQTHSHYKRKSFHPTSSRTTEVFTSHTIDGQSVFATSPLQATLATTKFNPPPGHCAPFWQKESKEMTTLSSKTLFENTHARFESHQVQLASGAILKDWVWFEEPDHINAVVHLSNGKILLFKQSKYGLVGESLAPVGGMIEKGESPLQAAKREVREETHHRCERWVFLGRFRTAANRGGGFCSSFVAQGCDRVPNEAQDNPFDFETQDQVIVTMDELRTALRRSEIKETKWVATFGLALMKMEVDDAQAFMDSRHGGGRVRV